MNKKVLLPQTEREIIEAVLRASNGCTVTAAVALGIAKGTLYSYIDKHQINLDEFREFHPPRRTSSYARWRPGQSTNGMAWLKQERILQELKATDYCRAKAARNLDISLSCMKAWVRHLKAIGVDIPDR